MLNLLRIAMACTISCVGAIQSFAEQRVNVIYIDGGSAHGDRWNDVKTMVDNLNYVAHMHFALSEMRGSGTVYFATKALTFFEGESQGVRPIYAYSGVGSLV